MKFSSSSLVRSALAAGLLASAAVVHAATPEVTPAGSIAQANTRLMAPASYSLDAVNDDLHYRTEGVSSSSDAVDNEIASLSPSGTETFAGTGAGQYGSRRRRSYGRSRYEDRWHNADGSNKIAIMAGAGMNVPVGNTGKFYTPSYDIAAGAGWNFNRQFGVLGEFHYDHAGLTGGALNYEYNNLLAIGATSDDLAGFDGNSHVISLSVNPVINFADSHSKLGAYVTGGVGYYRKTTNFTLPQIGQTCSYYYCYAYSANVNFDSYTNNAFGANAGFGLTYKLSEFSSERLFIEARYHWLKIDSTNASNDFFPFNRRNSEYIPVLVGIRF